MTARKTLDVTLGGLTCSIRGFDDPLPVFVRVVEYLRGLDPDLEGKALAADLPPLARIAQEPGGLRIEVEAPLPDDGAPAHFAPTPDPLHAPLGADLSPPAFRQVSQPRPEAPATRTLLSADEIASLTGEDDGENPLPAGRSLTPPLVLGSDSRAEARGVRHASSRDLQREALADSRVLPSEDEEDPSRPAPLLLSPRHRVDDAARAPSGNLMPHEHQDRPVPPPRVAPIGLAEFAAATGASTLPDLLEAAAAHAMVLEGRAHVSRPMLLRAIGAVDRNAADFEDELHAFGELLTGARLIKIGDGLYDISTELRFVSAAREIRDGTPGPARDKAREPAD